jgi:glutamate-1-semialdehyde 2,1-aminomutase
MIHEPPPAAADRFARSEELRRRAHAVIPGGAHTYAKGDDQYPRLAPGFITRGEGCRVWDVDGNAFIEYGMGLRSVTLGHAHPRVLRAAAAMLPAGANFTRPHAIEVELAEAFVELVPSAEMVKFTKDGSSATSAAVKLARAATGRDLVAFCHDHPFFSTDDWFIGSTAMAAGIPQAIRDLSLTFPYGDVAPLAALLDGHPGQVACVVMEPAKYDEPPAGYLQAVAEACRQRGVLFVLDEMITGFRWHARGAADLYGVQPDLSTFGKGMGNGFSVSALAGRRELMELGGLQHAAERVFLLSTTHGAETHALAAALEVIRIYNEEDVVGTMERQGARLAAACNELASDLGIEEHFGVIGRPSNLVFFTRDPAGEPSQHFRALFMQEMVRHGVLAPSFVVSYSHDDDAIDATIDAASRALVVYREALERGTTDGLLVGPPTRPVFRRFN